MMAATNQLDLLRILGVPASSWTFFPALLAALLAAPVLTVRYERQNPRDLVAMRLHTCYALPMPRLIRVRRPWARVWRSSSAPSSAGRAAST